MTLQTHWAFPESALLASALPESVAHLALAHLASAFPESAHPASVPGLLVVHSPLHSYQKLYTK
jgi:hypothetical protein